MDICVFKVVSSAHIARDVSVASFSTVCLESSGSRELGSQIVIGCIEFVP